MEGWGKARWCRKRGRAYDGSNIYKEPRMLVLPYVYHALSSFRQEFSRHRTWALFCAALLAFIGAREVMGVSSLCRFWQMEEAGYHQMLHLFRSTAWSAGALMAQWGNFVVEQ